MVPSPATSCLVVEGTFERNADVPVIPASTLKLVVAAAAPEDDRVEAILVDSDNDAARALVEELGGVEAIARPGVVALDATGHDRGNRATCAVLVEILVEHPDLPLAVAGRTGTLADRLVVATDRLRAKTGSISGVEALAGFVDDRAFALVLNDLPDVESGRRVQEALAATLVAS